MSSSDRLRGTYAVKAEILGWAKNDGEISTPAVVPRHRCPFAFLAFLCSTVVSIDWFESLESFESSVVAAVQPSDIRLVRFSTGRESSSGAWRISSPRSTTPLCTSRICPERKRCAV